VLLKRELYLDQIKPFIGAPLIKVLTGVRRCGKSSLLRIIESELVEMGINSDAIMFESFELYGENELSADELMAKTRKHISEFEMSYFFFDEVQLVEGWERVVNACLASGSAEIFITGSNSEMLSSELATLISGRYVEVEVRPLSLSEYGDFSQKLPQLAHADNFNLAETNTSESEVFAQFMKFGGFPIIHYLSPKTEDLVYRALRDIYSTVVMQDVVKRNNIRNIDLLERIIYFLMDNVGSLVSARKITDYFKSQNRKVSVDTVLTYAKSLENAYVFEKVRRFDLRGKRHLDVREKYYCVDVGMINALLGYSDTRLPGMIENILYLEFKRRGYEVFVGDFDGKEIDFVCKKEGIQFYVQATTLLTGNEKAIEREFGNLLQISDQYPKYVISIDQQWNSDIDGVMHYHLEEFLKSDRY